MASDMFTLRLDDRASALTDLNKRLKSLGRKETVTSINSSSEPYGFINRDIHYRYADGKRSNYKYLQQPTDSPDALAEKFLTHLRDSEYQQYLDDHKAMTLGSLFGENRFPRARERAFLDFRTLAASQQYFSDDRNYAPRDAEIRKVLCTYLTQVLLPGFLEEMVENCGASVGDAMIHLRWKSNSRTIRVPLSQDVPWYTAAQQARDTLRAWIDAEAQKKSETSTVAVDYTVWIWGIEYPNARVEYRESFERMPSRPGFDRGIYRAGAKTIGVPRTDEIFDISLKHKNGDVTVLKACTWSADGEVHCETILKNGVSSAQSWVGSIAQQQKAVEWGDGSKWGDPIPASKFGEVGRDVAQGFRQGVAAAQKIPAGAMVNSDGEVVGKATPARAMAYLNGTPVGVLTGIDYSGIVRLDTDAEGRVTTTAQQVADAINADKVKQEAIDRGYAATMKAIDVPTRDEIKRSLLERVANDGSRKASEVMVDLVAASTHETYKAIERLGQDVRAGFEQSRTRFDNLASQPLTAEALKKAFELMKASPIMPNYLGVTAGKDGNFVMSLETQLPQPPANIPLDFAPAIGDNESMPNISKVFSLNNELSDLVKWDGAITSVTSKMTVAGRICFVEYMIGNQLHSMDISNDIDAHQSIASELIRRGHASRKETTVSDTNAPSFKVRATTEAIEVAYRTAAIKLPDLVKRQLVKRMASKGGKAKPSQARLSLAEEMLSGDEGSLIVAGILSLALSASPEFIKSKMPWLDLDRLSRELRLNVETRIACAVADMLGMYLDGALEALKEAFGGSQQLLLAEGGKSDESALFNGVPKAESVGVR